MVPASVLQSMPSFPPPAPLFSSVRGPREGTRRWTLAVVAAVVVQAALVAVVSWSAGHGPSVLPASPSREVEVVFQAAAPRPAPVPAPAPRPARQKVAARVAAPAPAPVPEPVVDAPPPVPEVAAPLEPVAPWDLALVGTAGDGQPQQAVAAAGTGSMASPDSAPAGASGDVVGGQGAGGAGVSLDGYGADLSRAVTRHRRYPPQARRLRLEGTVLVEVDVARDGSLAGEPVVSRSSGHAVLDEEALRMVRVAAPFSPLPAGVSGEAAHFVLPVRFGIRE
jgi:protein TonB